MLSILYFPGKNIFLNVVSDDILLDIAALERRFLTQSPKPLYNPYFWQKNSRTRNWET